jgi:hypothetical protein
MVMDIATAMAMNNVLAMRRQWMDRWQRNGDGRLEDNATATQWQWSNGMEMDGAMVMDLALGDGNGQLVGW